jgi:hypothetical protein
LSLVHPRWIRGWPFRRALFAKRIGDDGADPALEPDIDLGGFRADHTTTACQRRILDDGPRALLRRFREALAHRRSIFRVQMNSNIARGCRELGQGSADDSDHLCGIHPQFPPRQLFAHGQCQVQEFLFDLGVQLSQGLSEQLQYGIQLVDARRERTERHLALGLRLGKTRLVATRLAFLQRLA